jgi:hypothetical protein
VGRLLKLASAAVVGIVLGVGLYAGLVETGLARDPFSPVARGDVSLARSSRPGIRVLFVGNSFTYENSMPLLVHDLAAADPKTRPIFSVEYAKGGWLLQQAAQDQGLAKLLREITWDDVVLQEQSQLLSFPLPQWRRETFPYAHSLDERIRFGGARTLLFMTWGYKLGDRRNEPHDTYLTMQERLTSGYANLGAGLGAGVVPVGLAWSQALRRNPTLPLWADDGRHPSLQGSYLTACVFYAYLTKRSPVGNRFTAGLPPARAHLLQSVAAEFRN